MKTYIQHYPAKTPEEKLKLLDKLVDVYCISSFKDKNEQQKLLKELEL